MWNQILTRLWITSRKRKNKIKQKQTQRMAFNVEFNLAWEQWDYIVLRIASNIDIVDIELKIVRWVKVTKNIQTQNEEKISNKNSKNIGQMPRNT